MQNLSVVLTLAVAMPTLSQTLVSPEVHPDGRVTFRLRAPNAKEVVLRCEGAKGGPMQKGPGDVWSITTEPLKPDIYAYSFAVDGLKVIDPANPLLKSKGIKLTWVETPGGHSFMVWRRYVAEIMPMLFQEKQ